MLPVPQEKGPSASFEIQIRADERLHSTPVIGDGNCLFRAFSLLLTGSQASHQHIREFIAFFMFTNQQLFSSLTGGSALKYLTDSGMLQTGVWGTELEIVAFATILNCRVYVFSKHGASSQWVPYDAMSGKYGIENEGECVLLSHISQHFEPVLSFEGLQCTSTV